MNSKTAIRLCSGRFRLEPKRKLDPDNPSSEYLRVSQLETSEDCIHGPKNFGRLVRDLGRRATQASRASLSLCDDRGPKYPDGTFIIACPRGRDHDHGEPECIAPARRASSSSRVLGLQSSPLRSRGPCQSRFIWNPLRRKFVT